MKHLRFTIYDLRALVVAAFFSLLPAMAHGQTLIVPWKSFTLTPLAGKRVEVLPVPVNQPNVFNTNVIGSDLGPFTNDVNGVTTISPIVPGTYKISISGNYTITPIQVTITNNTPTNATINAVDVLSRAAATNTAATSSYTIVASDNVFLKKTNIIAGTNVTIQTNGLNLTINSSGGGSNFVFDTNFTVSGTNVTLSNTAVSAGTYTKLTVDAKGRVNAGATLSASDLASGSADSTKYLRGDQTWQTLNSSAIGGIPQSNTVFVSKIGNDSTGARGRFDLPFLTLTAAKAAAQSGDAIIVYPGLYANEVNLAKDGVVWQFAGPGCVLSNFALNATGNTNAFFADSGSVTNFAVLGFPTLIYDTGTNLYNYDVGLDVPQGIGATNALQGIKITNANTTARFDIDSVTLHSFQSAQSPIAINIANCSNVTVNVRLLNQRNPGEIFTYTSTILGPVNFTAAATGIFWGLGEVYFNFGTVDYFSQYGIWGAEPSGVNTNNLWWTGGTMKTKIYIDSHSQTYRTWGRVDWLNCSNSVASFAADYFGGFHYLTAQKISDSVVGAVQVTSGGTLWLDAQKISSPTIWMHVTAVATNRLSAIVHDFEDLGSVTNGIDIEGGTNFITGQQARTINGAAVYFHPSVASKTKISGLNIDTSTGSGTNKWPVIANGAGLNLQGVNLISPANVFTIYSSSAQNVGILGTVMASTNKHANVTLQPLGTFIVDSNLQ